jgi:hypothetical protein
MELRRNRTYQKAKENQYTRKKKQTKHGRKKNGIKLRNKIQIKRNTERQKGIKIGIDGKSRETNSCHRKMKYK